MTDNIEARAIEAVWKSIKELPDLETPRKYAEVAARAVLAEIATGTGDAAGLIARADAALDGVTEGPWKWPYATWDNGWSLETEGENSYTGVGVDCPDENKILCIVGVDEAFGLDEIVDANARFIAAARQLVPALRDALAAALARANVDEVQG